MEKHTIWNFGRQFAREPILRPMADGSLICLFLTGGPTEPHNENVVMVSRSFNDGATWTEPATLFSHGARGVWSTELFVPLAGNTPAGDPFAVVQTYNAECFYRELQTFRSYTHDAGKTWSEPVSFPSGMNGVTRRQGIVLSNGEWLFPLYWQETRGGFDWTKQPDTWWNFCCGVTVSSDGGQTYARYGYIRAEKSLWEPNCVELEPGHVVMFMRDDSVPYLRRADSCDFGRTWSKGAVTDIPNPNTKVTLLKARGKVVLINNSTPVWGWENRKCLDIRISERCGGFDTFRLAAKLEPEAERWFYPHAFTDEKRELLYVAYENACEHRLQKFTYAELGL